MEIRSDHHNRSLGRPFAQLGLDFKGVEILAQDVHGPQFRLLTLNSLEGFGVSVFERTNLCSSLGLLPVLGNLNFWLGLLCSIIKARPAQPSLRLTSNHRGTLRALFVFGH